MRRGQERRRRNEVEKGEEMRVERRRGEMMRKGVVGERKREQ